MAGGEQPKLPESWRERARDFVAALKNVPPAFGLVWEADRGSASAMADVTVVGGALPICQAYVNKLIIDGILAAVHNGLTPAAGLRSILPYVLAQLSFYVLGNVSGQIRALCDKLLDHRLGHL